MFLILLKWRDLAFMTAGKDGMANYSELGEEVIPETGFLNYRSYCAYLSRGEMSFDAVRR